MTPVTTVEGRAYPLGLANIDTDAIIAADWLKTVSRAGLGEGAFARLRDAPGNVFDEPEFTAAPILIAGDNFGCGSSREHAAWAMADMGLRAVIAPGFSDIFASNAYKNGLLAVTLSQAAVDRLLDVARTHAIHIDLDSQTVTTPFQDRFTFAIDPFRKHCLLNGLDEIGLTLARGDAIAAFESRAGAARPWMMGSR